MKLKKFHISILFFIFINLSFCQISLFLWLNQNNYAFFSNTDLKNPENIHASAQETFTTNWLENPTFDDPVEPVWYSKGEGDISDVKAIAGLGHANLSVIGDQGTFSEISGTPTSQDWLNVTNPAFPALPDFHGIDEYGCEVNHTWIGPDDPIQSPSVHWKRNITMSVNISDYIITSASISAEFNASVTTSPGGDSTPNDFYGIDTPGDTVAQPGVYDSARFYVLISDLNDNEVYEVASYQSIDLGQDDPEISNITDTFMNTVVEETLIYYLNSLFERDNYNFQVTLGINIKCVDNFIYDRDRWDSLRIKSCSLSFNYVKKINQFTNVSWNQDGDKISNISNDTIVIDEALLNFKYKIDQNWPIELSPNSEIRILINDHKHSETIKLSTATTSFQEAKIDGFDITPLIIEHVNLSIEVFLADEFSLDRNITISIDDVYLNITYTVTFLDIVINTPENKTYTSPDSGYYPATYGFENEIDGTSRTDIAYVDSTNNIQSNCYVDIVNNFQGHNKVLRIYDQNTAGNAEARNHFTSPQQSGTIEWWWSTSASGSNMIDYLFYEGILGTGVGKLKMEDDNYLDMQDNIVQSYIANRWYHHRIEFDAASDTYNWSIDGVLRVNNGSFLTPVSNIGTMNINADWASYGNCYVDAIGYSWDPNYDVGDNLNEGLLLSYENSTNLDWQGYSLDGQANKTILGNTTLPMPVDGLHTIQVFGNDTMGTMYDSDVRHFSIFTGPPEIIINSPTYSQIVGSSAPSYDISITGPYDSIWYTLDGGTTNLTVSGLTGTIDQAAWDALADGIITIAFFANNSAGMEGSAQVMVFKDSSEEPPPEPPGIPGYDLYLLLGALSIISALLINKRVKS